MKGSWYGKLAGEEYFRRVQPSGRTVVWPDGQDIAPHELYEGRHRPALTLPPFCASVSSKKSGGAW